MFSKQHHYLSKLNNDITFWSTTSCVFAHHKLQTKNILFEQSQKYLLMLKHTKEKILFDFEIQQTSNKI